MLRDGLGFPLVYPSVACLSRVPDVPDVPGLPRVSCYAGDTGDSVRSGGHRQRVAVEHHLLGGYDRRFMLGPRRVVF